MGNWKPNRLLLGAALLALVGCGEVDGQELEPELRVTVDERTIGEWLERAESDVVLDDEEAVRAARALQTAIGFDDWSIRRRAGEATMALARTHAAAAPELVPWLADEGLVGTTASHALAELARDNEALVAPLVDALGSDDETVVAGALNGLRSASTTAVPALEAALGSANVERRVGAAALLSRYVGKQMISPEESARLAPIAVPVLLERLRGEEGLRRRGAAPSIGAWGAAAAFALPDVFAVLETESDAYTRTYLLQSVHGICRQGEVPQRYAAELAEIALSEQEGEVTPSANAVACLRLVPDVAQVVPEMAQRAVEGAGSSDVDTRRRSTRVLLALGTADNGGLDALLRGTSDPDARVRWNAVYGLSLLGPQRPDVVDALKAVLADEAANDDLRELAAQVLDEIETK